MIFFIRHDVNLKAMRKRVNKKGLYKKSHQSLLIRVAMCQLAPLAYISTA